MHEKDGSLSSLDWEGASKSCSKMLRYPYAIVTERLFFVPDYFLLSPFISLPTPLIAIDADLVLGFFPCGKEAWRAWCIRVGIRVKADNMLLVEF
jgi:hypothetical protein